MMVTSFTIESFTFRKQRSDQKLRINECKKSKEDDRGPVKKQRMGKLRDPIAIAEEDLDLDLHLTREKKVDAETEIEGENAVLDLNHLIGRIDIKEEEGLHHLLHRLLLA